MFKKQGISNGVNKTISSSNAIITIVVLAILFVGAVFAYQYYWPTPQEKTETQVDETADWQIYRNEEAGYEIKHPNFSEQESKYEAYSSISLSLSSTGLPFFMVFSEKYSGSLENFVLHSESSLDLNKGIETDSYVNIKNAYKDKTLLGLGSKELKLQFPAGGEPFGIRTYIVNNGIGYTIQAYSSDDNVESFLQNKDFFDLYYKILSTFKFIEKKQETNTLIWKAYMDQEFGFGFYYPKAWKLSVTNDIITLTNFGPFSEDDRITITKKIGDRVEDKDSKFGDVSYYYNQETKSWMADKESNFGEPTIKEAVSKFYTISGFPVFTGTGRWQTNIVPISVNKFLVINITGSGFTKVLDPFTGTISKANENISTEIINSLVETEIENEK